MNSYYHAQSSARKWGGSPEEYLRIHDFIDSSKQTIGDFRHRAMYHHTLGVYLVEKIFGPTLQVAKGMKVVRVPTRLVAERHIIEDLGRLPSPQDYLEYMTPAPWMSGAQRKTVNMSDFLGGKQ